ncbi:MAG TPA: hypothetical protein VLY04_15690 [Bryobacteraceae bacterium]|nr:hypothetical protein [Bryobacteraceae bacterium]
MGLLAPRLSVTMAVNVYVVAVGGVPLSVPELDKDSQLGRPPESANCSVPVPPLADRLAEYGLPTVHGGKGELVVMVGSGFTVTGYLPVADAWVVSVAVMKKLYWVGEATIGAAPPNTPAELMVSQLGRPVALQVMAPVPPFALKFCEYTSVDVVGGSGPVVMVIPRLMASGRVALPVAVALGTGPVTAACKVTLKGPVAVGVPERTPALDTPNPVGKPDADQEAVGAPAAVRVVLG